MLDLLQHLLGDEVFFGILLVFVAPEHHLPFVDVIRQIGVPGLPLLQAALFAGRFAVLLCPGEELQQQAVAGLLEGVGGTLESLEELGADQTADLLLPVFDERIDRLVRPDVVGQGIVDAQGEQRLVLLERLLDHAEQPAVGSLDRVVGNDGRLAGGEHGHAGPLLLLAFLDIGAAALDDECLEHPVAGQHPLGFGQVRFGRRAGCGRRLEQFPLHIDEMPPQRVNPQGIGEVVVVGRAILLPAHEQLGHVPEIVERVVHRRGREQEDLLLAARAFHQVEQLPVTGRAVRRLRPTRPGLRKWWASSMTMTSASSLTRWKRYG